MKINSDEYDTIGGLVINTFGHLPKRGESIIYENFNMKVIRADKRRVHQILFTRLDEKESTEELTKEEEK